MAFPLYFDEHVSHVAAARLRKDGLGVMTAAEAGLLGADDEVHLKFALANRRVVVTCDRKDFGQLATLWTEQGRGHAGVLVSASQNATRIYTRLLPILETHTPESIHNQVLWL